MIYFDNSSTTAQKPESVINAVANTLRYLSANPGRASHPPAMKAAMLVHHTRRKMAELVGCETEFVLFGYNCTDALNMAILGSYVEGGHVITTAYEHNSVLRPLFALKQQGKITLTVLLPNELGIVTAEMIERALKYNTYLLAINHVSNVTGCTSPITEIGKLSKKAGLLFLVDGAQSVGYTPIHMQEQNIDMLAIAPHKGLHGPQGVGCLALSPKAKIRPTRFGGTGTSSASTFQPLELPESMESGTAATPAIAGVAAAIAWNQKHFNAMQSKISELSVYLYAQLQAIQGLRIYTPGNVLNGICSFNVLGVNSAEVSNLLAEKYGICTRSGLHCAPLIHKFFGTLEQGMVRVSMGYENTAEEVDRLVRALKETVAFFA